VTPGSRGAAKEVSGAGPAVGGSASRRVAIGTISRGLGDLIAKGASLAFYIVMARKLGDGGFGDFIFGLSLAEALLFIAGVGSDALIAREVARDPKQVHSLFHNVLVFKRLSLFALWLVVWGVAALSGYPFETQVAILMIAAGVGIEYQTQVLYGVFQGREKNHFIGATLAIQRGVTAVAGIITLLLGGGLIAVSAVFLGGSIVGLAAAFFWMRRYVVRPRREVDPSRWPGLIRASLPLGVVLIVYTIFLRLDVISLGVLESDSSQVGLYGSARRLIDATLFVGWAFGAAMLPWLVRHGEEVQISLTRGYEIGLKVLTAILLPIGIVYLLGASALIELLYGDVYETAASSLRILAPLTLFLGIIYFLSVVAISRDRPTDFLWPAAAVLLVSAVLNLLLIPPLGPDGAALSIAVSALLLAVTTMIRFMGFIGRISPLRAFGSPTVAGIAMAAILLLAGETSVLSVLAAGAAYAAGFIGFECFAFRDDLVFYLRALGRPSARRTSS